jgi:DNA-binding Lrp family transcriptional regulator
MNHDDIIAVIRMLTAQHPDSYPPTYEEIGEALGITKQAVYKRVVKAQRDGLLTIKKHYPRSIVIL